MAVKRSFSVKNKSQCICLKCGAQILPDDLKDNTVYKCARCGQEMTVDRYESRAVLTVIEKPDLRRRVPPEIMNAAPQQKAEIMRASPSAAFSQSLASCRSSFIFVFAVCS